MSYKIIPVILCGGSGTRLWPLSREDKPKQFLSLLNEMSLVQDTILRAQRACGAADDEFVAVTLGASSRDLANQMRELGAGFASHILCEPCARDTAAAVAYAAHYVAQTFGEKSILWVLPADHHIKDDYALKQSLDNAVQAAAQGYLTTFGIKPSRPETGYGYIRFKDEAVVGDARLVDTFVEKPDLETAQNYLKSGEFLWNSGMFVLQAKAVLENYLEHADDIFRATKQAMDKNPQSPDSEKYQQIRKTPFDKAIMEKSAETGGVAVIPCDLGWSDIGSWESLWEILEKDPYGNVANGAALYKSEGCYVHGGSNRLIACAGLKDVVVVDTGDAIMIADKFSSDDLKAMVQGLKKAGRREVSISPNKQSVSPMISKLMWPKEKQAQEIIVEADKEVFSQNNDDKDRICAILEGEARIILKDGEYTLEEGQTMTIAPGAAYRIYNPTGEALRFVEMKTGTTGEQDRRILSPEKSKELNAA